MKSKVGCRATPFQLLAGIGRGAVIFAWKMNQHTQKQRIRAVLHIIDHPGFKCRVGGIDKPSASAAATLGRAISGDVRVGASGAEGGNTRENS